MALTSLRASILLSSISKLDLVSTCGFDTVIEVTVGDGFFGITSPLDGIETIRFEAVKGEGTNEGEVFDIFDVCAETAEKPLVSCIRVNKHSSIYKGKPGSPRIGVLSLSYSRVIAFAYTMPREEIQNKDE